jgi:hypothetical protein
MDDVLKRVVKITNLIRAHGLNHRHFASLLHELECDHKDVTYHTEIRCLYCKKAVRIFFYLRNEIILFLGTKKENVSDIKSTKWIQHLVFMVDILRKLKMQLCDSMC